MTTRTNSFLRAYLLVPNYCFHSLIQLGSPSPLPTVQLGQARWGGSILERESNHCRHHAPSWLLCLSPCSSTTFIPRVSVATRAILYGQRRGLDLKLVAERDRQRQVPPNFALGGSCCSPSDRWHPPQLFATNGEIVASNKPSKALGVALSNSSQR
jgi:hypothetical protein